MYLNVYVCVRVPCAFYVDVYVYFESGIIAFGECARTLCPSHANFILLFVVDLRDLSSDAFAERRHADTELSGAAAISELPKEASSSDSTAGTTDVSKEQAAAATSMPSTKA